MLASLKKILNLSAALCGCFFIGSLASSVEAQPINDNFANRETISGTNISGSLAGATSEPNEPMLQGISTGQTAWWSWTAPSNGIVTLNVSASSFNPLLTVYSGNSFETLSLVASNNYLACYESTNCGCHWRMRNQTTFHVARGLAYQVAVDTAILGDASWHWIPEQRTAITNVFIVQLLDGSYETNYYYLYLALLAGSGSWNLVQTTNILAGSDLQLGLRFMPAPINDDVENRIKLSGLRTHIVTSNSGATKQAGEPDHLGVPGGSSVWYSWKAPASGRATLSTNNIPPYLPPSWQGSYGLTETLLINHFGAPPTCGNEIDQNPPPQFFPVFAAYTGSSVDSLTSANALPVSLTAFPYVIEFDAVKGQTYQIAFDGNQGTTGETPLYLALTKPAVNDSFKNRIHLHGINLVATSYNAGATHQPGEPVPAPGSNGKTVWWSWRAPVTGSVSVDVSKSEYQFPVSVFTGSTFSSLTLITNGSSAVSFDGIAGETYQIAVADSSGLTGAINLSLQAPVIEVPLIQNRRLSARRTLLRYAASDGQVILLQRSHRGGNWKNVSQVLARRNSIEFLVSPAPIPERIVYRAIIVDQVFR